MYHLLWKRQSEGVTGQLDLATELGGDQTGGAAGEDAGWTVLQHCRLGPDLLVPLNCHSRGQSIIFISLSDH